MNAVSAVKLEMESLICPTVLLGYIQGKAEAASGEERNDASPWEKNGGEGPTEAIIVDKPIPGTLGGKLCNAP